ncbi:MAG: T9SS type A sorting domain-containing protein [Bacteroidota bacterium]
MKRLLEITTAVSMGILCFAIWSATASAQFVQKANGGGNLKSSVQATFSSTPVTGNCLIAIVGASTTSTINTPSGWSSAINQTGAPGQAIFYKFAGSSEPKTVTVTLSDTLSVLGLQIYEYHNISSVSTLDGTSSATGTGTSISSGTITTTQASDLIIVGIVTRMATSFSSWSNSFNEQFDFQVGTTYVRTYGGADRTTSSTGTYSTTATAGNSGAWRAQIVAFKDPAPLPIQMVASAANVVRDNQVEVTWRTASETNNYGFEIYRKRGESGDWSKVDFVQGHGTTLAPQSYSYIDASPAFGKYYYQIRQVDLDGTSETFPAMEVTVGAASQTLTLAQNYPNPFNPSTVIEFVVPMSGHATMKVYNMLGQEVTTLFEGNAEAGRINTARFNASNLPSGLYFYTLRSAGKAETKRMLLTK